MSLATRPIRALPAAVALPSGRRTGTERRFRPSGVILIGVCLGAPLVGVAAGLQPVFGLVAVVAVLAGVVVVRRPELGGLALVALVPVLSGLRRGLPVPGLRLSEVLVGGIAVAILLTVRPSPERRWRTFDWLALAYAVATLGVGLVDVVLRRGTLDLLAVGNMVGPFQFLLLYRAVIAALPTRAARVRALRLLLLASVPISLLAIGQEVNVPGLRAIPAALTDTSEGNLFAASLQEGFGRATGLFPQWHTLGAYLSIVILVGAGVAAFGLRDVMRGRTLALVLGLASVALLFTLTWTWMLTTIAGVLVLAAITARLADAVIAVLLVGALGAAVAAPALAGRYEQQYSSQGATTQSSTLVPQTLAYRASVWQRDYVPLLRGRWIAGWGPGALPATTQWGFTENGYITMLVRGGVILLAVFLALIWSLAALGRQVARTAPDGFGRMIGTVLWLSVLLLLVAQVTVPVFVFVGYPHVLWIVAALAMAERAAADTRAGGERVPSRR